MKRFFKWFAISLLCLVTVSVAGMYIWSQQTLAPTNELTSQINIEEIVDDEGDVILLPNDEIKAGIVLYPGAKVENTAYSYYGKKLADAGYAVFIPKLRLNFAIMDQDAASNFIEHYPEIKTWYVGGHSLGGVAASSFANENASVKGLILLASYPSDGTNLSDESLNVISIYSEKDGLTEISDIENSKSRLPLTAKYVEITGGNHAQFGIYGEQKGDKQADISALDQQNKMVEETLLWLENNG